MSAVSTSKAQAQLARNMFQRTRNLVVVAKETNTRLRALFAPLFVLCWLFTRDGWTLLLDLLQNIARGGLLEPNSRHCLIFVVSPFDNCDHLLPK